MSHLLSVMVQTKSLFMNIYQGAIFNNMSVITTQGVKSPKFTLSAFFDKLLQPEMYYPCLLTL